MTRFQEGHNEVVGIARGAAHRGLVGDEAVGAEDGMCACGRSQSILSPVLPSG
jgi:hypothetical protein